MLCHHTAHCRCIAPIDLLYQSEETLRHVGRPRKVNCLTGYVRPTTSVLPYTHIKAMQGQVLPGRAAPTAGQVLLPAKGCKSTRAAAARCTGRSGTHVACAATLAQEQSAAAQNNGVGKAQAGTQLQFALLCAAQQAVSLWPVGDRHHWSSHEWQFTWRLLHCSPDI